MIRLSIFWLATVTALATAGCVIGSDAPPAPSRRPPTPNRGGRRWPRDLPSWLGRRIPPAAAGFRADTAADRPSAAPGQWRERLADVRGSAGDRRRGPGRARVRGRGVPRPARAGFAGSGRRARSDRRGRRRAPSRRAAPCGRGAGRGSGLQDNPRPALGVRRAAGDRVGLERRPALCRVRRGAARDAAHRLGRSDPSDDARLGPARRGDRERSALCQPLPLRRAAHRRRRRKHRQSPRPALAAGDHHAAARYIRSRRGLADSAPSRTARSRCSTSARSALPSTWSERGTPPSERAGRARSSPCSPSSPPPVRPRWPPPSRSRCWSISPSTTVATHTRCRRPSGPTASRSAQPASCRFLWERLLTAFRRALSVRTTRTRRSRSDPTAPRSRFSARRPACSSVVPGRRSTWESTTTRPYTDTRSSTR